MFDGMPYPACEINMLSTARRQHRVSVELTGENLEYLKVAFELEDINHSKERQKPEVGSSKAVRWYAKRNAYVAFLETESPAKMKCKTFKVSKHDDCNQARESALSWVAQGG